MRGEQDINVRRVERLKKKRAIHGCVAELLTVNSSEPQWE
jgi:hypothetical protein